MRATESDDRAGKRRMVACGGRIARQRASYWDSRRGVRRGTIKQIVGNWPVDNRFDGGCFPTCATWRIAR